MGKAFVFATLLFAGAFALAQESAPVSSGSGDQSENYAPSLLERATGILAEAKTAADIANEAAVNAKNAAEQVMKAAESVEKAAKDVKGAIPKAYPDSGAASSPTGKLLGFNVGIGNIAGFGLVAALAAIAAAIAAIVACWLAMNAGRTAKDGADKASDAIGAAKSASEAINALKEQLTALHGVVAGQDSASLKKQIERMKEPLEQTKALGARIDVLARDVNDIPAKVNAAVRPLADAANAVSRKVANGVFGMEDIPLGSDALAPKLIRQLKDLGDELRRIVTTDEDLRKKDADLQARKARVDERERRIDEDIAAARKAVAASAESFQRGMAEKISSQAQMFGEEKQKLENDCNMAKVEVQRAIQAQREAENKAAVAARERDSANAAREAIERALRTEKEALTSRIKELEDAAKQKEADIKSERETMRETVAAELRAQYSEQISGLERNVSEAKAAQGRAEEETRAIRGEKDAVDKELASVKSALEAEKGMRQADADNAAKVLAAEKDGRAADKVAAEAVLDTEKKGRIADKEAAAKALEAEKNGRAADAAAAAATLAAEKEARAADAAAADSALAAVRTRLFPPPFGGNAAFEPLLSDLEAWDVEGIPGATLARASLAIIANREHLPDTIWQNALFDLSLGLSSAMEARNIAAAEAAATLTRWKTAVESLRASGPSFSLNLPSIGRSVDMSWMRSQSNAGTVRRIRAWAVYNSSGLVCLAEVE